VKYKFPYLLKTALNFCYTITISFLSLLPAHGQSSKILRMIPANASLVFTVNGNSINKKTDFNKIKTHPAFKFLDSLAQLQLKGNYTFLSRLYKNSSELGIDFISNIYSFYRKSDNSANYFGGIFIPLSNKDKFEKFLLEAGGTSVNGKIIRKRGYSYISEEGFLFAWTKKYCMIVSKPFLYQGSDRDLSIQLINKIIHQKTKHSILNNQDFVLSQKNNFDFSYWINYQSFFNQSLIQTFRTEDVAEDNKDFFTGNYVHSYVNVNNGNITYDSKFFIKDRFSKKTKGVSEKKANPDLLKYFHKDTLLGLVCFSIDLRETQITVNENMRKSKEKFKSEIMTNLFRQEFEKDSTLIVKNQELNDLQYKYHSTDTIPFTYTPPALIEIETVPVSDSIKPEIVKNDTVTYSYSYLDYDFLEDLIKNKNNEIKARKNELANNKIKELGHTENDIWDLFEGDVVIGLTDLNYKETKYTTFEAGEPHDAPSRIEKIKKEIFPKFIIAATAYKTGTVKKVLMSLEKQGTVINHGHYYKLVTGNSGYYLTLSDKILIISNDEDLIKNKPKVYSESDMLPNNVQENILSNGFSMYFNLERTLSKMPRDTSYELYNNLFPGKLKNLASKVNFQSHNLSSKELILTMVNKTNNALYEVFRLINQFYLISIKR
jgi:hypothetical protein